jgi:hypothetical protein
MQDSLDGLLDLQQSLIKFNDFTSQSFHLCKIFSSLQTKLVNLNQTVTEQVLFYLLQKHDESLLFFFQFIKTD